MAQMNQTLFLQHAMDDAARNAGSGLNPALRKVIESQIEQAKRADDIVPIMDDKVDLCPTAEEGHAYAQS